MVTLEEPGEDLGEGDDSENRADANNARLTRSLWFTAASTNWYLPKSTRINEPEIPGRIMAQIASMPLRNRNQADSGVCTGTAPTRK